MATSSAMSLVTVLGVIVLMHQLSFASCADLGVNYGTRGSNLPSPFTVINFLTSGMMNNSIPLIRIQEPNQEILQALRGTKLVVSMVIPDSSIPLMASDFGYASFWVNTFILQYKDIRYRYLIVGSESIPGPNAQFILPAMSSLHDILGQAGLLNTIMVTTAVSASVLGTSYPPSAGHFSPQSEAIMGPIVRFLYDKSPLMIHVQPYNSLVLDPGISLDYALFEAREPFIDGTYRYYSLFEAIVDAFIYAIEKELGEEGVRIAVGQTGWPVAGYSSYANIQNAMTYNNNLKALVKGDKGTPRRPDLNLETYILELFSEDLKSTLDDKCFGTFYPNFSPIYELWN
ncbi:hypothetical protein Droror1_Dr00007823 [Drosera rotundifolia]